MNQDVAESTFISDSDIAIIAISCRFPGANNTRQFWQNLRDGVESISWFEDDEVLAEGIDAKILENPNYVKAGAILEDIDKFDAFFFDINSREAAIIDPQHRIFLECASEAIEKAGYNPYNDNSNAISEASTAAIALYAGVGMNSYFLNSVTVE